MSHRLTEPQVDQGSSRPSTAQPRVGWKEADSTHRAALIAGAGILLLGALAAIANLSVLRGLVVDGSAAQTAHVAVDSDVAFRLAIVSLYVVVALDVLVAWALMRVYTPVHAGLSRLAGWFRLAYAAVFLVAIAQLIGIPGLLSTRESSAFTPAQVDVLTVAKVDAYNDIWMAGLLLFGIHLILLGYLTHRSTQMPNLLGILLVVAGLGYAFDTVATVLSGGSLFLVSTVTFLGELLLAFWLLIRGHRLTPDDTHQPHIAADGQGERP